MHLSAQFIALTTTALFLTGWASYPHFVFNALSSQAFILMAIISAIMAWHYPLTVSRAGLAAFLIFVGTSLAISYISPEPWPALAMDTHWMLVAVAIPLFAAQLKTEESTFHLIRLAAATTILYTLTRMWLEAENYIFWLRNPVFGHIRHFGLSLGFCATLLYCANDSSGLARWFFRVVRIVGLALVFWSGTRAAMLAWAICIVVLWRGDRESWKTTIPETFLAMAIAAIPSPPLQGLGILSAFRHTFGAASADALSSGRISLWSSALDHLVHSDMLWFGIGGNGFVRAQWLLNAEIVPFGHIHPHNFLIQALYDWGVIGTSAFLALLIVRARKLPIIELFRNRPSALIAGLYLAVTGMFDATLYLFEFLIYLTVALAILETSSNQIRTPQNEVAIPRILVIALLGALIVPHLMALDYRIGFRWYFRTYDFPW